MLLLCTVGSPAVEQRADGSVLSRGSKYNKTIDFDAYKAYRSARNRPPLTPPATNGAPPLLQDSLLPASNETVGGLMPAPANPAEPPAPYPTSFAQIVELITSGKPVPGIKEVPPTVLTGQGTQPAQTRRKKPWEKHDTAASMEGLGQSATS